MRLQERYQLVLGHPARLVGSMGHQVGDGLAADGNDKSLTRLDTPEQVGGFVSKLSGGNFYDSATSVAPTLEGARR